MKKYSVEEAIDIGNRVTLATGVLVGAAVLLAVGVALIKLLWAWTIPELFPGAVAQGLVAAELSWAAALKVTVLVALLSGTRAVVVGRWSGRLSVF